VSLAFLLLSLLLPFSILLSKTVKTRPRALAAVAFLPLAGMWLDKYLLVVPSLTHEHYHPAWWLETAVTAGFAALVLLSVWAYSRFLPLLLHDSHDLHYGH
jgi:hypothetical protein